MKEEKLRPFEYHGVVFQGHTDTQSYGDCPFCGREKKFYVNQERLLWDCKVCGKRGNLSKFLEEIQSQNERDMTLQDYQALSKDRGLPIDALKSYCFGKGNGNYTLAIRNSKGYVQDIRTYAFGQKMRSSPGCFVGLLNIQKLIRDVTDDPVFICEGEWDGIAFDWMLKKLKLPGIVLAVPGANTFKDAWVPFFHSRDVHLLYDNDEAGETGELQVYNKIRKVSKSVSFLHWTDQFPKGFDIRDLVINEAIKKRNVINAWNVLHVMFKEEPRQKGVEGIDTTKTKATFLEEVYETFDRWLYIEDKRGLDICLATLLSNVIGGDPLWMFIVSPPGGAKTEMLTACNLCPNTYFTSSLSAHALISGSHSASGQDPSIIPKLDGKTLIIKDFTAILNKREQERDEIFGTLRDAYDGTCGKDFGHGVSRRYRSRFTVLAAVTTKIYELTTQHASLGERFLKFRIGENIHHVSEPFVVEKAISNVGKEVNMREEIAEKVRDFISYKLSIMQETYPTIPEEIIGKLVALAQFGARLRGVVTRDRMNSAMVLSKPAAEIGSRLGKQLVKLAISLAIVMGLKEVNDMVYGLVKKTVLDTISQRDEDIVKELLIRLPTINDTMKTKEVSFNTGYPSSTISRILADMDMLGIVTKLGKANAYQWTLSEYIRGLIEKSEVYSDLKKPT